ncbi:flagellar filament capping protein FliD [Ferdinandcohnia quinoae]|uniref:Flagellar hook-associated protein 2 n=1 Tax=Fredinandcohnia quinoae TaxID=2918902 RepID=A0AAW5DXI3_9BACI|nr:flagellar filament capping protein FliD [Fredinandcohnia sp. SECRCQ15]MCH1625058.1 flagellar filament capping protein FliD [Fredinandcohnia sp. SECRCQ15]
MRITGFASGLDTAQIITDLMKAERMPLDKLFQKKEWLQWQRDAYRDVNLELDTFKKNNDKLRFQSSFNGYKASNTNSNVASVTAKSSAVSGNYEVEVIKVAEAAKIFSGNPITSANGNVKGSDKILSGTTPTTIQINTKDSTGNVLTGKEITIDDKTTFSSLATQIANLTDSNGKSLGLRASFDDATGRFVISTKDTGLKQEITIKDTGTIGVANAIVNGGAISNTPLLETNFKGIDAEVKVSGGSGVSVATVTSATNDLTVYGMDIKIAAKGTTTVNVSSDTDAIFDNIKKFVEDYNSLIDSLNTKTKEKRQRDYAPLTEEQREGLTEKEAEKWDKAAQSGLLYNDPILRGALNDLRIKMYQPVDSIPSGNIRMLSEIGISTGYLSTDGKLTINEEKLREAIANNPDEVMNLFTKDDGIATRIMDGVNSTVKKLVEKAGSLNSPSNLDTSVIGKDLTELKERMDSWEDKLKMIENRYWKQFTAMETAIEKMNQQSSSLMGMFG